MDQLYISIDAGATKTQAIAFTSSGKIIGKGKSKQANIHNVSVKEAFNHIQSAINDAFNNIHPAPKTIPKICVIGLSGLDTPLDYEKVREFFKNQPLSFSSPANKIILVNDSCLGLFSGTHQKWGICMIAGTGSNGYGINKSGAEASAGNWGHILGDQGSGYALGQGILKQVMREFDGRSEKTSLTQSVLNHLQLNHPHELITWTYNHSQLVKRIASLSTICDQPNISSIPSVAKLIEDIISAQSSSFQAVTHKLKLKRQDKFPVIFIGGLFNNQSLIANPLIQKILSINPKAQIIYPNHPPVYGGVNIIKSILNKHNLPKSALIIHPQ